MEGDSSSYREHGVPCVGFWVADEATPSLVAALAAALQAACFETGLWTALKEGAVTGEVPEPRFMSGVDVTAYFEDDPPGLEDVELEVELELDDFVPKLLKEGLGGITRPHVSRSLVGLTVVSRCFPQARRITSCQ